MSATPIRRGGLLDMMRATAAPWLIEEVASAAGGVSHVGEREHLIGYIVTLKNGSRFQLRAWRTVDGSLREPSCEPLPRLL